MTAQNDDDNISISVVVPVFCSATTLPVLYERLAHQLDALTPTWEIILVDDASTDAAWNVVCELCCADPRVKGIRFGCNQGQQHATLCGLSYAKHRYVVTIDDDLQCYPEDLPLFVEKLKAGKSVVIGKIHSKDKRHRWWRNLGSRLNQYLAGKIIRKPTSLALSSFRAMSLPVATRLLGYKGAHPHIAAMLLKSVPHDLICNVDIRHAPRTDGRQTSYSLIKLLKVLSYLLINHSYMPLRFMIGWGMTLSVLSLCYALWIAVQALGEGSVLPGWSSITVLISFLSGNILLALGILGEYLGRLVENASASQQFPIFDKRL